MMESIAKSLDITGMVCPMTWMQIRMALARLSDGDVLEVVLDDGEPVKNLARSAKEDGHTIVSLRREDRSWRVLIRKGFVQ
jgi:tRNA 2-thiouridine synthesizing protein A